MRIESRGMSRGEVATAITGAILAEGIGSDIIENLSKSKHGGGEVPMEPAVRAVIAQWEAQHRKLLDYLEANLTKWAAYKQGLDEAGLARVFFPYLARRRRAKLDPNLEDLREVSWLVMEHYRLAAGFGSGHWEGPYGEVFLKANLAVPLVDMAGLAYQAYLAGRGIPMSEHRADIHAATFAAAHAGAFITGLGNRMGTLVLQRGLATLAETYHDTISNFIAAKLRGEDPQFTDHWARLTAVLHDVIGEADLGRDMARIAATETRWAYNVGRIQYMAETGTKKVRYIVQPTACELCKRVYLHRNGKPKIFSIGSIMRDVALHGGLNAGRPTKDVVPSALLHPNCHCAPVDAEKPTPPMYAPPKPAEEPTA